ncbi:hypothetical protein P389DRAFT_170879 [Cystobasidium minutum MCA 4210]|uniref:uncharacterized protein n=1 Tax=Cystobasidium minutum MCA 4210 TaxID=1397322 RepID=UPI0034CFEBEB|eukprot:jgi/Rhomi1/170879/fgenesh1_kg.4_\
MPDSASSNGTLATSITSPVSAQVPDSKTSIYSSYHFAEGQASQVRSGNETFSFTNGADSGYYESYAALDGKNGGTAHQATGSDVTVANCHGLAGQFPSYPGQSPASMQQMQTQTEQEPTTNPQIHSAY